MRLWQNILSVMKTPIPITRTERVDDIPQLIAQMNRMAIEPVLGKHFSEARELARAQFRGNSGRVAGLYSEPRRSSLERSVQDWVPEMRKV